MTGLVYVQGSFAPSWIALPPWALSDCIVAVVGRSTVGVALAPEQRLCHYPNSPHFTVSALFSGHAELVSGMGNPTEGPRWRASALSLAGPSTEPRSTVVAPDSHGLGVFFYPDAWQRLSGMVADDWINRYAQAAALLPAPLQDAFDGLWQASDDAQRLDIFFERLKPIWQRTRAAQGHFPRQRADTLRNWSHALALRAAQTGIGKSLRQAERRIKQWTGTSMRTLHSRARAEEAFFRVMERMTWAEVPDWADMAHDCGYADQSHFIRAVREVTGFTPQAFHRGLQAEESFWIYRTWALLLGLSPVPALE
nr:AraC family transcriptional regulator [uncultured Rhodoferax sp.]